jgi:hypothetical protein
LLVFGIPAAVIGSWIWRRVRPARSVPRIEPLTPETLAQATAEQPLAMRAWLDYVNAQPDRVPHLAIIGPSGAGKTTAATAVLSDRPGRVVVITAKEGDDWGGLPYVGIDRDATYATARETFAALEQEVKQRLVDAKDKRLTADWLTIAVDDFSTLVKEVPIAADVVKLAARLGRSLRVRLVMLSDSALVKAIGLEGEGETRSNFAFVRLRRGHSGTLDVEGADVPIDTAMLDQIARRANLKGRQWREAREADVELSEILAIPMPQWGQKSADDSATLCYATTATSGTLMPDSDNTPLPGDEEAKMIRNLLQTHSRNAVARLLGGSMTTAYQRIHRAIGQTNE